MKNKLLKSLALTSVAVAGAVAPMLAITSCSNSKSHNVRLDCKTATIDKTQASEGKDFEATITSRFEIVKVLTVEVSGIPVLKSAYKFTPDTDEGKTGKVWIDKEVIKGDIVITAITRPESSTTLVSVEDDVDNAGFVSSYGFFNEDDLREGFDFTFITNFGFMRSWPLSDWSSVHVFNGDTELYELIDYNIDWSSDLEHDAGSVTITFKPEVVTKDVTIVLTRNVYIYTLDADGKTGFNFYNVDAQDYIEVAFKALRGRKLVLEGQLEKSQLYDYDSSNIEVYIENYKLPTSNYQVEVKADHDLYYVVQVTINGYAVLGDVTIAPIVTEK